MTSQGTQNFLNGLRVAGRMWGSHGDKITNAVQGRNYDDERAARLGASSPGALATGAGDSPIMRQVSRDLVVSPTSPFITRQSSNVGMGGGGRDGATSPSILRQTSRDAFGGGATSPTPPLPMIGRQVSRDLALPEILRQHSRELGAGSPSSLGRDGGGGGGGSPNTFRPIGGVPGSGGGSNRDLSASPVSFLVPTLPPSSPTAALRPSPTRVPSSPRGAAGGGASLSSPTGHSFLRQKSYGTENGLPSIPATIMEEAAKDVVKRDNAAHGAEKAAAKALRYADGTAGSGSDGGGGGGLESFAGGKGGEGGGKKKQAQMQPTPEGELSTTVKADLVRQQRKSSLGTSRFGRRKKSIGGSIDGSGGSNGSGGSGGDKTLGSTESTASAGGGAKWKPGQFFKLIKKGGAGHDNDNTSKQSSNGASGVDKEPSAA